MTLRLAGDGDERAALEARAAELGLDSRVEFLGSLGRDEVLALFRSADAAILSSAWENFPHTVVEALAVGTPVIATAVGGVPEIVTDGENGLLVPPGDPAALAAAIRRFFAEPELRERLRSAAAPSVERFAPERVYGELERNPRGGGAVKRLLIVGRTRYRLPLEPSLARKFDALRAVLELRVLSSAPAGGADRRRHVHARAALLAARPRRPGLPARAPVAGRPRAARLPAGRDPHPEPPRGGRVPARAAARAAASARVVVELHGDWRTATRLYGSPARRVLAPLVDRLGTAALRRADAVRTVSPYTTGLAREIGVEPAATFPAYMDLEPFLGERKPLPGHPSVLFVGVLERYKNVDGLAEAWRAVSARVPGAQLRIVGDGPHALGRRVARACAGTATSLRPRSRPRSTTPPCSCSRPARKGWAACSSRRSAAAAGWSRRGSAGSATSSPTERAGSSSSRARPGRSPTRWCACVSDGALATRLGDGAAAAAGAWLQTPEQYAERILALVEAG